MNEYIIREMKCEDYENVYTLWKSIQGFHIRELDDSKGSIERFIRRNPSTSIVAEAGGKIIGAILCGQDGRRGCLYHVCVAEQYRKQGVGKAMVTKALEALEKEGISKAFIVAFTDNEAGNRFWQEIGWKWRSDLNYYDYKLREDNEEVCI